MSRSVFISHAVADKELAHEIVRLIEEGVGVPEAEIFCSSLQGYDIPNGENFVTHIKSQLIAPKVVVLLLTPSYFESQFCVSELGAAWIKSHAIFPILVPPLGYDAVQSVLLGTQVIKIGDDIAYNQLREKLLEEVDCHETSSTKWDTKRRAFLKNIAPLLENVRPASKVSADVHKALQARLDEAQAELDASEAEIRKLKDQLAATEKLKNQAAVAAVQAEFAPAENHAGVADEFDALARDIASLRGKFGRQVLTAILCARYGHPYTIDRDDEAEFEQAAQYRQLDLDDGLQVLWSNPTLRTLDQKLDKLEAFVRMNQTELEVAKADDDLDPASRSFWEEHYGL